MKIYNRILVIGHKGASLITPENTIRAFQKAIDLEADLIEFDIHLSKDGEIVIIHDINTLNTSGYNGLVRNMTLNELKQLDFGEGEKIPTILELIDIAKGKIGLIFEIKAQGITEKLAKIISKEALISQSIISSFSFKELMNFQKHEPNVKIGLLLSEALKSKRIIKKRIQKAIINQFYSIHPHYNIIDNDIIEFCHENNLKIFAWTVNDEKDMKNLVKMGIDGIMTDDIQLLKKIIKK